MSAPSASRLVAASSSEKITLGRMWSMSDVSCARQPMQSRYR